jgi:hypothetical protein
VEPAATIIDLSALSDQSTVMRTIATAVTRSEITASTASSVNEPEAAGLTFRILHPMDAGSDVVSSVVGGYQRTRRTADPSE